MKEQKLTLLNTSVLTSYGTFVYQSLTLQDAQELIRKFQAEDKPIESAIGHQSTADLLSMLLAFPVEVNRVEFKQTTDDVVLVFKLKGRAIEGKILNQEELENIGYEFGVLTRLT